MAVSEPVRRCRRPAAICDDLREVDAAEVGEHQEHGDEEAEVADAVDDERLLARGRRVVGLVVEADQQVGAEPDPFPADEHQQIAAAEDQDQHRGRGRG